MSRDGARRLNELPGVALAQNLGGKRRVQGVPAPMDDQMPHDGVTDERQVSHNIQNLVTHELVVEAQRVEHTRLAEHHGVLE